MTWVIGLQALAGLCFAALTVWRPFMRSDSLSHKIWHTAIGVVGIAALAVGALLNGASQTRYTKALNNLTASVQSLAGPASAGKNANVDQILAAAASKLIQQDQKIRQLQRSVRSITHPLDGIYLDGSIVAEAQGKIWKEGSVLIFQLIIAGANGLDFRNTFSFRGLRIICRKPSAIGRSGHFGVVTTSYPNTKCQIVRQN